jgi:Tol biopolymer transport system component
MDQNGNDIKVVIPDAGTFNIEPRYSPDGSKFVFMSGRDHGQHIYVANTDGSNIKKITDKGANGDPFWSPDGSRISFGSNREGGGKLNIFTMKPDGSDVKQITHFLPPYESGDTSWSPDGKYIVFEWDVDGKGQSDPNARAEVWIVPSDGSGEPVSTGQPCAGVGCSPRWQPAK